MNRAMKPSVSAELRNRVIELRRSHSFSAVAKQTGLSVGTVKTICSRSGSFRDNPKHRALFSLPPIRESNQTLPAEIRIPEQEIVTGDIEVDAVIWLRRVISTGDMALVEMAMEAARKIKTPLVDIEKRYTKHLVSVNPGNVFATFASFDFHDLQGWATKSVERLTLRNEAISRFGDSLFEDTKAELFCIECLRGLETDGFNGLRDDQVNQCFMDFSELLPNTLSDCLYELAYWNDLYRLRRSVDSDACESSPEASARDSFVFRRLAQIRPRSKDEAILVFHYLANDDVDRMSWIETNDILRNLIGR